MCILACSCKASVNGVLLNAGMYPKPSSFTRFISERALRICPAGYCAPSCFCMTLSISSAMKQMKKCALMRCVSVAAGIGMPSNNAKKQTNRPQRGLVCSYPRQRRGTGDSAACAACASPLAATLPTTPRDRQIDRNAVSLAVNPRQRRGTGDSAACAACASPLAATLPTTPRNRQIDRNAVSLAVNPRQRRGDRR